MSVQSTTVSWSDIADAPTPAKRGGLLFLSYSPPNETRLAECATRPRTTKRLTALGRGDAVEFFGSE